jgi:ankyrin repeat protein
MKTSWDIVKDGTARGIDVNAQAVVLRTGNPPYGASESFTHAQFLGGHRQDHLIDTFGYAVVVEVIAAVLSFHPLDQTASEAAPFREAINQALDRAIANGELESLNLIIQAGANINRKGSYYGMTPLMNACSSPHPNKYEIMKLLLQHGADPNATDDGGDNLLMRVFSGSSGTRDELDTLAPLLLDHGLDINARNRNGKTALQQACWWGRLDVVKHLMQRGANIHEVDQRKETLLVEVMQGGTSPAIPGQHAEIARLLIENGADVNTKGGFGDTVLMFACERGHLDLAKFLLERGADIHQVNDKVFRGRTALMGAAWAGQVESVKLLLAHNAEVNAADTGKETALFKAAYNGHAEVAGILLENGADIDARDYRGNTPLLHAASRGHAGVVELLLKRGAEVNAKNQQDWNALMQACTVGHLGTAKLLVAYKSEVNLSGKEASATPLMLACWRDSVALVDLLLQSGADVHWKDSEGKTAFERVIQSTLQYDAPNQIVKSLLDAGADLESRHFHGCTPLSIAAIKGNPTVLQWLLEKGSQVNAADKFGVTPLMQAAMYGHQEAVEWLLLHNAEVNAKAQTGKTAFAFASEGGHAEIARLLAAAREGAIEEKAEGPLCSFEDCPICQDLPDSVSADMARGEALPPAAGRLIKRSRCPYCGTRYECSNDSEGGLNPYDIDTLTRVKIPGNGEA